MSLEVRHVDGERFEVAVRGHDLLVDQPGPGGDAGPTSVELFVAGLASCVAFYARRYLVRHDLPVEGLTVRGDFEMGSRPARVASIRVEIGLPDDVPVERHSALLAVASHCTVHNSLDDPPHVTVELAASDQLDRRATA